MRPSCRVTRQLRHLRAVRTDLGKQHRHADGSALDFQTDGNVVIYATDGQPVWASNTGPASGCVLVMQNDGNLVLRSSAGLSLWDSATGVVRGANALYPGESLSAGQSITSPDGSYAAAMQRDGNFVLYGPSGPLWASNTGVPGSWVQMNSDGNLVVVSPSWQPVWASGTQTAGYAVLAVQDDGNLVIYAANGPAWDRTRGLITSPPAPGSLTAFYASTVGDAAIERVRELHRRMRQPDHPVPENRVRTAGSPGQCARLPARRLEQTCPGWAGRGSTDRNFSDGDILVWGKNNPASSYGARRDLVPGSDLRPVGDALRRIRRLRPRPPGPWADAGQPVVDRVCRPLAPQLERTAHVPRAGH